MGDWDQIQCGYDALDETINFGTRHLAGLSNLYETTTLATIKNSNQESNRLPIINSAIINGSIYFSINKTFRIFENLNCLDLSYCASFEDDIDIFCTAMNGSLILLCFQTGKVSLLMLGEEIQQRLCEKTIFQNEDTKGPFFLNVVCEIESTGFVFYLLSRNGMLHRFMLPLDITSDMDKEEFKVDLIVDLKTDLRYAFLKFPTLFYTSSEHTVQYNIEDKEVVTQQIGSFTKICRFTTTIYIGLNDKGELMNICSRTSLISQINIDILYDDFLLISDASSTHLLAITKKNEFGHFNVQLMVYPEREIIFSIKVTEIIHFITPEDINDEIMYTAEIRNKESVKELRFQTITETLPENRLQRLLRRQKIDEAEKIAKLFNLDLTEVQKAKAQIIVDKSVCTEEDITNLINVLDDLKDDNFKIISCLDIHICCCNLKDVERVLKYLNSIPQSTTNENLQQSASELWLRFQTFMMLVRSDSSRSTVESWTLFYDCNLIKKMHELLEGGEVEQWRIIYSRLDAATLERLCEDDVLKSLEIISEFPFEDQMSFLNTFIPITLNFFPSTLQFLIDWIILKVDYIEKLDFKNFPENALDFLNKSIQLLKIKTYNKFVFHQQAVTSLKEIKNLIDTLKKVKSLKDDHGIVLPFQQMLQGPESLVRALLGTLSYGSQNQKFLEDFIQKFILNSPLKPDDLFGDIINNIVKYEENYWIKIVLLMLKHINSIGKKLEATIIVLRVAKVPWCNAIRDIALNSLKYSHPLVEAIYSKIEEESKTVVFHKKPYNINYKIENASFFRLATKRIIYCKPPTMIEDTYQVCNCLKEKAIADVLIIHYLIKIGDFSEALKLLKNNSNEDMVKCCKTLVEYMVNALDAQDWKCLENYFQIIGSILEKFENSSFIKHRYQKTVDDLRCLYFMHRTFNINVQRNNFYEQSKKLVFRQVIVRIVEEYNEDDDVVKCINRCEAFASHLRINNDRVLLEFCKEIADYSVILNAANLIYETTNDTKVLCELVVVMLTYIGSPDINLHYSDIRSFCDYDSIDVQPFLCGLKLARKIVAKAIINSSIINVVECLELGNWVEATYSLVQPKIDSLRLEVDRIEEAILPSISVFNAIKSSFCFYMNFGGQQGFTNINGNSDDSVMLVEDRISTEVRSLHSTITSLASEGNVFIAYKLIVTLYASSNFRIGLKSVRKYLASCLKQFAKLLVEYIFSSQSIDVNLTANLLVICGDLPNSKRFLVQSLQRYKLNLYKLEKIAATCLFYLKYYNEKDGQLLCTNILFLAKWWKKLKNCHISYEEFFRHPPNEIIFKLIKFNDLNIDMIDEFCSNINVNVQDYYKLYLEVLFLNWKPNYTLVTNRCKESIIMNHNGEEYVQKCMNVIKLIDDQQLVLRVLDSIWKKINFYHYEVFVCVLDILKLLNQNKSYEQKGILLTFLINYNRVSKPGEAETEQWRTLYPDTRSIDILSTWRLPFTPTLMSNEIWSIIRPEINLKTYKEWFKTMPVLKHLNKNDICSYAIKDLVSSGILRSDETDQWLIHARHKELLREVDACVANMSNLEQATSTLYSLVTNIPEGADLVKAAKLCYKYALQYQQENVNSLDVQKAVTKVEKTYIQFSIKHILHVNHLAENKYLKMVSSPVEDLIEHLYMDNRILERIENVDMHCPDINQAVEQLSLLYNIDVEEKQKELLNNWLSIDSVRNSEGLSLLNPFSRNSSAGTEYLTRAVYLCSSDVSNWQLYLLSLGNAVKSESINLGLRAMALKCFCNISNGDTIENLTGLQYEDLRNYINKLSLISELENFGFSLTVQTIDEQNKDELLRRLSYQMNNKVAVKTMACICIIYTIYKAKYWRKITTAMVKLKMFQELKESIIFLNKCTILSNCQWYIEAWQQVINDSFKQCNDKSSYIESFFLVQTCPILLSVNLDFVPKMCFVIKQYDLVILSLQYLGQDLQQFYLKELKKLNVCVDEQITQLSNLGFWGVPHIQQIVTEFKSKESVSCDI